MQTLIAENQRLSAEVEALRHASSHDVLTRILNRAGLMSTMSEWSGDGLDYMTIALMDLDDFKAYNDFQGHAEGDRILIETALQAQQCAEKFDGTAARLSGDEFCIAVPRDSGACGQELLDAVSVPVSVGTVTGPCCEGMSLLPLADIALYHSKTVLGSCLTRYYTGMGMPTPKGRRTIRDAEQYLAGMDHGENQIRKEYNEPQHH